jgi:phenylacetate-CoA ligase
VVDDTGRALPPGEIGDIVISNLLNRATVLLNYRIGDRGMIDDRPCGCGRTFPKLANLEGRSEERVRLPNGRVIETSMVTSVFKYRDDVERHQIVQRDWRFDIRVQPAAGGDPEQIRHEVADGYRRMFGPESRIEVFIVDHIEHDRRRKMRRIVVLPGTGDGTAAES